MKLRVLSEQIRGATAYLLPEEFKVWEALTEMVDTILSEYPEALFTKRKGLLSWKIYLGSGVDNPADDWEDQFGKNEPIVDVSYDKFPVDQSFELSIYRPSTPEETDLYGESRLDYREKFPIEGGLPQMAPIIRRALTRAVS